MDKKALIKIRKITPKNENNKRKKNGEDEQKV